MNRREFPQSDKWCVQKKSTANTIHNQIKSFPLTIWNKGRMFALTTPL